MKYVAHIFRFFTLKVKILLTLVYLYSMFHLIQSLSKGLLLYFAAIVEVSLVSLFKQLVLLFEGII